MLFKSTPVDPIIVERVQDTHIPTLRKTHERYIIRSIARGVLVFLMYVGPDGGVEQKTLWLVIHQTNNDKNSSRLLFELYL